MSEKSNPTNGVKDFNRYQTKSYVNDTTDFGGVGQKQRKAAEDSAFRIGSFVRRSPGLTKNDKSKYSAGLSATPTLFGELGEKYQGKNAVPTDRVDVTTPAPEVIRSEESKDFAPTSYVKRTDSADEFFLGSNKGATPTTPEVPKAPDGALSWTPISHTGVSRSEKIRDSQDFLELYGNEKSEAEKIYEKYLDSANSKAASGDTVKDSVLANYEKAIEKKKSVKDPTEEYDSFIRRKAKNEALVGESEKEKLINEEKKYSNSLEPSQSFSFIKNRSRSRGISDLAKTAKDEELKSQLKMVETAHEKQSISSMQNRIAELRRKIKTARRKFEKLGAIDGEAYLCEALNLTRELIIIYYESISLSSKNRKFKRLLSGEIEEYNKLVRAWCSLTSSSAPTLPHSLPKEAASGMPLPSIPKFEYSKKESSRRPVTKEEEEESRKEAMELLREEAEWKKRGGKSRVYRKRSGDVFTDDGLKMHLKFNSRVSHAKVKYRISKLKGTLSLTDYKLGPPKSSDKIKKRRLKEKLGILKRGSSSLYRLETANATKILSALSPSKRQKAIHPDMQDTVNEIKSRLRNLLLERDEVNQRLLSLYTGRDSSSSDKSYNSFDNIMKVRRRGAKRGYRSQLKLYREVNKFRIPLSDKEQIYDLMNEKTELYSEVAECKYRLRHLSGSTSSARELHTRLIMAKKDIKRKTAAINSLTKRYGKKSSKADNPKKQWLWFLLLLGIIGGALLLWYFLRNTAAGEFLPDFPLS